MINEKNTTDNPRLSWNMVVDKFENLIKYASKQQVQNHSTDSMVTAEDLYQEGMIKLYNCWQKWCVGEDKDMDEFGAIFKKSLFRAMGKSGRVTASSQLCINLDDEILENMSSESTTDQFVEDMYLSEGLKHLADLLSEDARLLLQELESPSDRTLYEVWADLKRKEMLKSQGHKVNIPKDNTVRMKHIMRALGMTTKQYDLAMAEIRQKAKLVIEI